MEEWSRSQTADHSDLWFGNGIMYGGVPARLLPFLQKLSCAGVKGYDCLMVVFSSCGLSLLPHCHLLPLPFILFQAHIIPPSSFTFSSLSTLPFTQSYPSFLPLLSKSIPLISHLLIPPPFPFSLSTLSFISFTAEPSARSLWQCQHCPQQQLQSVWQVHPTRLPAQWPGGRSRIGTVSAGEITRLRSGTKCKRSNITTSV